MTDNWRNCIYANTGSWKQCSNRWSVTLFVELNY